MIKTVWKGYLYDGKKRPLIEVLDATYIKLQGWNDGSCRLMGILDYNAQPCSIGLQTVRDLRSHKVMTTDHIYMADISGYKYIYVESDGFKKVYGVTYGIEDEREPIEGEVHEYNAVIILDTYSALIQLEDF